MRSCWPFLRPRAPSPTLAPWPRPACYRDKSWRFAIPTTTRLLPRSFRRLKSALRGVSRLRTNVLDRRRSRIMISKALNLSDRLSGCAKLANACSRSRRAICGLSLPHRHGRRLRRRARRIPGALQHEWHRIERGSFQKLAEEISLETLTTKLDLPWGKGEVCLYYGEVPMGNPSSCWCCAKAAHANCCPTERSASLRPQLLRGGTASALRLVAASNARKTSGWKPPAPELSRLAGHPPYHYHFSD